MILFGVRLKELQGNKSDVGAVRKNALAFEACSKALRSDPEVIIEALKQNPKAIDFIPENTRNHIYEIQKIPSHLA